MDKKTIAVILGIVLTAAGAFLHFDFKGAVCGNPDAAQSESK